jgi:hypothetical protein
MIRKNCSRVLADTTFMKGRCTLTINESGKQNRIKCNFEYSDNFSSSIIPPRNASIVSYQIDLTNECDEDDGLATVGCHLDPNIFRTFSSLRTVTPQHSISAKEDMLSTKSNEHLRVSANYIPLLRAKSKSLLEKKNMWNSEEKHKSATLISRNTMPFDFVIQNSKNDKSGSFDIALETESRNLKGLNEDANHEKNKDSIAVTSNMFTVNMDTETK